MKGEKGMQKGKVLSSFRDPSGFLFYRRGILLRQVNVVYKEHYEHLMSSGLFKFLTGKDLLVSSEEVDSRNKFSEDAYVVIKPELVQFISYPYEWCFSQLKDAALLTLQIQKYALDHGMTLKDASAYNIQFSKGTPKFIDALSFERYEEGSPWVAYRQFCQHFLAPLALMSYKDVRISQLLRIYIDGIPLDLASSLLPFRSFLNPSLDAHIHFHAKMQARHGGKQQFSHSYVLVKKGLYALIDSLESVVRSLRWKPKGTEWGTYYEHTNYSKEAFENKKSSIKGFLEHAKPKKVWDIGGNLGIFSRIASDENIETVSFDVDPVAVEKNYLHMRAKHEKHILPLVLDVLNPSPGLGWMHTERDSLQSRGPADLVMALALVHHLAITNNVPFSDIAKFFSMIGKWLIIEFVPKEDSQVKLLLSSRRDIISYTREEFEKAFSAYFTIEKVRKIKDSHRSIYLMKTI